MALKLSLPLMSLILLILTNVDPATAQTGTILCQGLPAGDYCDCGGDCTDFPAFCECEEAQECCASSNAGNDDLYGNDDYGNDDGDETYSGWIEDISSPFDVYAVDDTCGCQVPPKKAKAMKARGFTKVACPFGVLIAGTDGYPENDLKFGANVIAEILDPEQNGVPADSALVEILTYRNKSKGGALLQCGVSQEEESQGDGLARGGLFDYSFSCQTWKAYNLQDFEGIMMEEAFHMVHQLGYAVLYPEELGMEDHSSSIISRETARLQCVSPGYFHPENTCPADSPREPGNPASSPLDGTCNDPNCDVAEFYKMVLFLAIGMGEENDPSGPYVWQSDYTPGKQDEVLAMLSTEFKEMINTPSLHQLTAPLTGKYDVDEDMSDDACVKSGAWQSTVWLSLVAALIVSYQIMIS